MELDPFKASMSPARRKLLPRFKLSRKSLKNHFCGISLESEFSRLICEVWGCPRRTTCIRHLAPSRCAALIGGNRAAFCPIANLGDFFRARYAQRLRRVNLRNQNFRRQLLFLAECRIQPGYD